MPKRYEKIRDSLKKKMDEDDAKRIAAKTYNKTRKKGEPKLSPVTPPEIATQELGVLVIS